MSLEKEKTFHIVANANVYGRLLSYKRLYKFHTITDTLKAILDNWEYNVPIETSQKELKFKYKERK